MDIKGTEELVKVIEILGVSAKKIAKDGVNLADLPEAIELIKHIDEFMAAIKDFHLVGSELKDIDQTELLLLGTKVFSAFKAIQAA